MSASHHSHPALSPSPGPELIQTHLPLTTPPAHTHKPSEFNLKPTLTPKFRLNCSLETRTTLIPSAYPAKVADVTMCVWVCVCVCYYSTNAGSSHTGAVLRGSGGRLPIQNSSPLCAPQMKFTTPIFQQKYMLLHHKDCRCKFVSSHLCPNLPPWPSMPSPNCDHDPIPTQIVPICPHGPPRPNLTVTMTLSQPKLFPSASMAFHALT